MARQDYPDELIPDPKVAQLLNTTVRSLRRWDTDPKAGFPSRYRIGNRNYRNAAELAEYQRQRRVTK